MKQVWNNLSDIQTSVSISNNFNSIKTAVAISPADLNTGNAADVPAVTASANVSPRPADSDSAAVVTASASHAAATALSNNNPCDDGDAQHCTEGFVRCLWPITIGPVEFPRRCNAGSILNR